VAWRPGLFVARLILKMFSSYGYLDGSNLNPPVYDIESKVQTDIRQKSFCEQRPSDPLRYSTLDYLKTSNLLTIEAARSYIGGSERICISFISICKPFPQIQVARLLYLAQIYPPAQEYCMASLGTRQHLPTRISCGEQH
jgi:hypothetical protein